MATCRHKTDLYRLFFAEISAKKWCGADMDLGVLCMAVSETPLKSNNYYYYAIGHNHGSDKRLNVLFKL